MKANCRSRNRPAETAFFEQLTEDGWVSRFSEKHAAEEERAKNKRKSSLLPDEDGSFRGLEQIKRIAREAATAGVAARREAALVVSGQGGSRANSGRRKGHCGKALTASLRERLRAKTGKSSSEMSARQIERVLGMYEDMDRAALEERVRTLRGKGGLDHTGVQAKARAQLAAAKRRDRASEIEEKHREWAELCLSHAKDELSRLQRGVKEDEQEFGERLQFKDEASQHQLMKVMHQIHALKTLYRKLVEGGDRDDCIEAAADHVHVSVHTIQEWDSDFRTNGRLEVNCQTITL
ncbi:unnamed protein product [Ectocarpus sp. CCAP 1310/34]|nr:unnamed protein product [Ectocarpus sp. CCAP 1310/34]